MDWQRLLLIAILTCLIAVVNYFIYQKIKRYFLSLRAVWFFLYHYKSYSKSFRTFFWYYTLDNRLDIFKAVANNVIVGIAIVRYPTKRLSALPTIIEHIAHIGSNIALIAFFREMEDNIFLCYPNTITKLRISNNSKNTSHWKYVLTEKLGYKQERNFDFDHTSYVKSKIIEYTC